jgi:hypothetical protein
MRIRYALLALRIQFPSKIILMAMRLVMDAAAGTEKIKFKPIFFLKFSI